MIFMRSLTPELIDINRLEDLSLSLALTYFSFGSGARLKLAIHNLDTWPYSYCSPRSPS